MNFNRSVPRKAEAAPRGAEGGLAVNELGVKSVPLIQVTSLAFREGCRLPEWCAADKGGMPPPIHIDGVPGKARSLVVICEDPDTQSARPFVHWLVYGLDPSIGALGCELPTNAIEGLNTFREHGFTGAAPPPGQGHHHYHFQVFALDIPLRLPPGIERTELLKRMKGHVIAFGEIVGNYER